MQGVINVYKEKDWTSHDVVSKIRFTLKKNGIKEKVGHTGTLDPNATGVLPICIGKATKLSDYIMKGDKVYKCHLIFGVKTDTDDYLGKIIGESNIPKEEDVLSSISSFIGGYEQTPPMYSALKVNGKKLYEYAREGKEIEIKKRFIFIENINVKKISNEEYLLEVFCSKGTYIRSLCRDIGAKINVASTMGDLERVKTGMFIKEDGKKIDYICNEIENKKTDNLLIPVEKLLIDFKSITICSKAEKYLYNGNKINIKYALDIKNINEEKEVLVFDEKGILIGLYTLENGYLKPKVFLLDR